MTQFTSAHDGFRLAYDRIDRTGPGEPAGSGPGDEPAVVLLHGWPGDRHDYRLVLEHLVGSARGSGTPVRAVVPDLRGFGETQGPRSGPGREPGGESTPDAAAYGTPAQAEAVVALIEELELGPVVLGGYDVGSRVAQQIARSRPDLVVGLALSPPLPGSGRRLLQPERLVNYWYQSFHQLDLIEQLLDGDPARVRAYLAHFWHEWSAPTYRPDEAELDRLAERYGGPGAMTASIGFYRAGAGSVALAEHEQAPEPDDRIAVPTIVLWSTEDPLVGADWSDRLSEFFADVELRVAEGAGHFVPLEAPAAFAAALTDLVSRAS